MDVAIEAKHLPKTHSFFTTLFFLLLGPARPSSLSRMVLEYLPSATMEVFWWSRSPLGTESMSSEDLVAPSIMLWLYWTFTSV